MFKDPHDHKNQQQSYLKLPCVILNCLEIH